MKLRCSKCRCLYHGWESIALSATARCNPASDFSIASDRWTDIVDDGQAKESTWVVARRPGARGGCHAEAQRQSSRAQSQSEQGFGVPGPVTPTCRRNFRGQPRRAHYWPRISLTWWPWFLQLLLSISSGGVSVADDALRQMYISESSRVLWLLVEGDMDIRGIIVDPGGVGPAFPRGRNAERMHTAMD